MTNEIILMIFGFLLGAYIGWKYLSKFQISKK